MGEYDRMNFRVWNVNKKGNIDPIQNLILQDGKTMFAILFCYCHHFIFKN